MRTLLLIHVQPFAVVTADALTLDDYRPANGSPLALLLADLAGLAFRPAFDPEHREVRKQAKKRADRTEKSAVQIPNENRSNEQRCNADPHRDRSRARKHPERFHVAVIRMSLVTRKYNTTAA